MTQKVWLGWKLDPGNRKVLLARFPPRYERTIADHVTFGPADNSPPMPEIKCVRVVGRADDGEGVEALVVALDGATARWDGSTYHITWSLAKERKAVESNEVIANRGWSEVPAGPDVVMTRATWP